MDSQILLRGHSDFILRVNFLKKLIKILRMREFNRSSGSLDLLNLKDMVFHLVVILIMGRVDMFVSLLIKGFLFWLIKRLNSHCLNANKMRRGFNSIILNIIRLLNCS